MAEPPRVVRHLRTNDDRISALPDDLLLHIMTFLSFKDVFKTSILARRWEGLWLKFPVLHLHGPAPREKVFNEDECDKIVTQFNAVLQKYNSELMKEFKIICELDSYNKVEIDSWLVYAFARKVEYLELDFSIGGFEGFIPVDFLYEFPDPILNFGSRNANSDDGMYRFQQSGLSCLKSLSLKRVELSDEIINSILLNCRFLERLEVVGSSKLVKLVISGPNLPLKYLKIKQCGFLKDLSISEVGLVSLDIPAINGLILINLPKVVELFINGTSSALSRSLSQATSFSSNLEALSLTGINLEDAAMLRSYVFLKLKRLIIHVGAENGDLTMLLTIISNIPCLEEFVFKLDWSEAEPSMRTTRKGAYGGRGSTYKSQTLKVFEFVGFQGHATDIELINRALKMCLRLEKIIIDPRDPLFIGVFRRRTINEDKARYAATKLVDNLRKYERKHMQFLLR